MSQRIATAVLELLLDGAQFVEGLDKVEKKSKTSSDGITTGFLKAEAITAAFKVAVDVVGNALAAATTRAAEYGDKIANASERTGISAGTLSAWNIAAETSDTNFEALTNGAAKMAKGMESNSDAFRQLGVQVKEADGTLRPMDAVMADVAEKFSHMEDGATKAALAQEIFGKSGAELIPFLNQGAAGLAEAAEQAERFGLTISGEAAAAAKQFNDDITLNGLALDGLAMTIGEAVIPTLDVMIQAVTEVIVAVKDWMKANQPLVKSLVDLGRNIVVVLVDFIARAIESISDLVGMAGTVAYALGMDGLAGKLETVAKTGHSMALGLKTVNDKMADAFYATTKVKQEQEKLAPVLARSTEEIKKSEDAVKKAAAAHDKLVEATIKAAALSAKMAEAAENEMEKVTSLNLSIGEAKMKRDMLNASLERTAQINELSIQSTNLMMAGINDLNTAIGPLLLSFEAEVGVNQAIKKTLDDVNAAMGINIDLLAETTGQTRDQILAERDAADGAARKAEADKASAESYQRVWETATANVTSGFVDAFSDVIFHAASFSEAMKNVAVTTAESMFKALMTGLVSPLTSAMSALGKKISDTLLGAIGGGGGGGGMGGLLGGAGGFLTNPFTIGAGAIAAGVIAWSKSQAHHEADTWVKQYQEPFDRAMAAAGSTEEKLRLMDEYLVALDTFSKQGSDEATVARQAYATFQQYYGGIRADAQAAMASQVVPEPQLASYDSTSSTMAGGGTYGGTTYNITVSGVVGDIADVARRIGTELQKLTRDEGLVLVGVR